MQMYLVIRHLLLNSSVVFYLAWHWPSWVYSIHWSFGWVWWVSVKESMRITIHFRKVTSFRDKNLVRAM